jgi:hypothetical protein
LLEVLEWRRDQDGRRDHDVLVAPHVRQRLAALIAHAAGLVLDVADRAGVNDDGASGVRAAEVMELGIGSDAVAVVRGERGTGRELGDQLCDRGALLGRHAVPRAGEADVHDFAFEWPPALLRCRTQVSRCSKTNVRAIT